MTNLLAIRKYLRSLSEQKKSKRKNGEKGRGNSRNVSTYDIVDTGGQR